MLPSDMVRMIRCVGVQRLASRERVCLGNIGAERDECSVTVERPALQATRELHREPILQAEAGHRRTGEIAERSTERPVQDIHRQKPSRGGKYESGILRRKRNHEDRASSGN